MRKLMLLNFRAKTGELEFEDYRLIVVDHNPGELEQELQIKATNAFVKQFKDYFPESKLLSALAYPTVGAEEQPVKGPETYGHEYELSLAGNFTPEYPALTANVTSLKSGKTETHSFKSPEDFGRQAMQEIVDHLNDEMVDKGTVTKIKITIKAEY